MTTVRFLPLLLLILLFCFCGLASAAELTVPEVSGFNGFMTNTLQPLILSLLATVVAAAVTYLTAVLKRKFGIEISAATADRLRGIAWDAVNAVEEKAAVAAIEAGGKWLSTTKHSEAVNYILSKVPALSMEEADTLVQAALAKTKGLGATAGIGA